MSWFLFATTAPAERVDFAFDWEVKAEVNLGAAARRIVGLRE